MQVYFFTILSLRRFTSEGPQWSGITEKMLGRFKERGNTILVVFKCRSNKQIGDQFSLILQIMTGVVLGWTNEVLSLSLTAYRIVYLVFKHMSGAISAKLVFKLLFAFSQKRLLWRIKASHLFLFHFSFSFPIYLSYYSSLQDADFVIYISKDSGLSFQYLPIQGLGVTVTSVCNQF